MTSLRRLFRFVLVTAATLPMPAIGGQQSLRSADGAVPELLALAHRASLTAYPAATWVTEVKRTAAASPAWPLDLFLRGEGYWIRGDLDAARREYRDLVDWSAGDPYGDGRGGAGVAAIALWRLLDDDVASIAARITADGYPLLERAERVLDSSSGLPRRLLQRPAPRVYPDLSGVREEVLRQLVDLAYAMGDTQRAKRLFRGGLEAKTDLRLTVAERTLLGEMVQEGSVSRSNILLNQGRNLSRMGRYRDAAAAFGDASRGDNAGARMAALLELSRLWRIVGRPRNEVLTLLDSLVDELDQMRDDPLLAQQILIDRARAHNRAGTGAGADAALRDYELLVYLFPDGEEVDEAIYQSASLRGSGGDIAGASEDYEKLRDLTGVGQRDRADSAYFWHAMLLYDNGELEGALSLLRDLERDRPLGALHIHSLFWMGRLNEEMGRMGEARTAFARVVAEFPLERGVDYYALRSLMHLNVGPEAREMVLPDEETSRALGAVYAVEARGGPLAAQSPYLRRVERAFDSGLYGALFEDSQRYERAGLPLRSTSDPLALDEVGWLAAVVVRASLFQDALVAPEVRNSADRRIRVAGLFAAEGDWTKASGVLGYIPSERGRGYLRRAYPPAFAEELRSAAETYGVEAEALYSVMRSESSFAPAALSRAGALGLFQFIPATFSALDGEWGLLDDGSNTRESYLTDPELSIDLAGRWMRRLADGHDGDLLYALMEHNAGPIVQRWKGGWVDGRGNDVEFRAQTVPYGQTRQFLRSVLVGMAVARASGMFEGSGETRVGRVEPRP